MLIWATRKHEAPTIAAFVSSHDASHAEGRAQYSAFALGALSRGFTPLFEWCEAKHSPGVVQHAQDSLTLLAMRHMVSGRYLGRDQLVREPQHSVFQSPPRSPFRRHSQMPTVVLTSVPAMPLHNRRGASPSQCYSARYSTPGKASKRRC